VLLPCSARWCVVTLVVCLATGISIEPAPVQSGQTAAILAEYRHGDADAAVEALRRLPGARAEAGAALAPNADDPWQEAALALLYTEAAFRDAAYIPYSGPSSPLDPFTTAALGAAGQLATLGRPPGDARLRDFARQWLILTGSLMLRAHYHDVPEPLLRFGEQAFPQDPDVLLFVASARAALMGPEVEEHDGIHFAQVTGAAAAQQLRVRATPTIGSSHGTFNADIARDVEAALRQALKIEPALVEARVRLGQLLAWLDRTREAQSELEQAFAEAQTGQRAYEGYLAAMFLGQLHERAKRLTDAADAYAKAAALLPHAPAARLALGRLRLTAGSPVEGWTDIRQVFSDPAGLGDADIDPWVTYWDAQYWQAPERLATLRQMVRASPVGAAGSSQGRLAPVDPAGPQAAPARSVLAGTNAEGPVFRGGVEGVRVDVSVTDGGRPVTGLRPDQFEVLDNGVRQDLESAAAVAGLSVVIVLDTSDSVVAAIGGSKAGELARAGQAIARALGPTDVTSVITVDDRIALRAYATRVPQAVARALAISPTWHAKSALWDATLAAASLATARSERPVVIALSDFADNASWITGGSFVDQPRREREALADLLKRAGVLFDMVSVPFRERPGRIGNGNLAGLGPSLLWDLDEYVGSLAGAEMAESTGGQWFDGQADLTGPMARHLQDLRSGYVLTFTPKGVKGDDGWHKLTIQLKGAKGRVSARPGYYATAPGKSGAP